MSRGVALILVCFGCLVCSVLMIETLFYMFENVHNMELNRNGMMASNNDTSLSRKSRDVIAEVPCRRRSSRELRSILGPAYNRHYMSIARPKEDHYPYPFKVSNDYINDNVDDGSKFESRNGDLESPVNSFNFSRAQYASVVALSRGVELPKMLPWLCPWRVQWIDMGEDVFPRYMRSVKCKSESCWFDRMSCQERAFVVMVLKRKNAKCFANQRIVDEIFPLRPARTSKLPPELQEQWIFEERAANFCCECTDS